MFLFLPAKVGGGPTIRALSETDDAGLFNKNKRD